MWIIPASIAFAVALIYGVYRLTTASGKVEATVDPIPAPEPVVAAPVRHKRKAKKTAKK